MRPGSTLKHEFVRAIPDQLQGGVVYISIDFSTVAHKCCCGCGSEVVTPLSPTDWKLIFDGETISLEPSIGNWNLPCRSHYFIRRNRVQWSRPWSREEIAAEQASNATAKARYYLSAPTELEVTAPVGTPSHVPGTEPNPAAEVKATPQESSWRRLMKWITGC